MNLAAIFNHYKLIIFFLYGLAFFVMGIAILIQAKKESTFKIGLCIGFLAWFGILHGFNEWFDMFLILGKTYWPNVFYFTLKIIRAFLATLSFCFLLIFGSEIITINSKKIWLQKFIRMFSIFSIILVLLTGVFTIFSNQWFLYVDIFARYLIGFPGGILSAIGLLIYCKTSEIQELQSTKICGWFLGASVFLSAYAVLAGIIVPKAPFFPAYIINYVTFAKLTMGIPIQLFRMVCAIFISYYIIKILEIFHTKTKELLEVKKLKTTLMQTIRALSRTTAKRDPYTSDHQNRVAQLSPAIAKEIGMTEKQIEGIRLGSLIHDIGKIYVPLEFLNRSGKLSELEIATIRMHPQMGHEITKDIDFPWPVHDIILQHHERLDGSGYPNGLKDKDITIEAKIVAVADVVEAMMSHRPYRPALGMNAALEEISKNKGILFDTNIVEACLRLFHNNKFAFNKENNHWIQ
ncbi:MAG: HD-GYP domain-containing protein [Gammaproteobacteria bacterium]|jgi:putative nucleotidyltransferase with HDIG domain